MTKVWSQAQPQGWTAAGTAAAIILAAVLLRLFIGATMGMGVDESYTVSNARQLSLGYFDHPPLHQWIVWATVALTGSEAPLVVRLPFILMFAGTSWMMFLLGRAFFGNWAGTWAAAALNLSAVFTLSAGGWVVPDGPLMFFMMAAALCLARLFFPEKFGGETRHPLLLWLAAGLFIGLATLAKYHGVFLGLGILLFVLTSAPHRRWLAHPGPWLGAILALLVFSPALIWNWQNDWVSLAFQSGRGMPSGRLRPELVLQNIVGQMAWLLPWIFIPMAWLLFKALKQGPKGRERWFLACLAIGPIAIFTIVPLWGSRGLPHWQAPGWLMVFPLLGALLATRLAEGRTWPRRWLKYSTVTLLALLAFAWSHVVTGWVPLPKDPTHEAVDWTGLEQALESRGLLDRPDVFVVSVRWLEGGKIDYALGGRAPVLVLTRDPRHFAFRFDPRDFQGQDAVIVGRERSMEKAAATYAPYFEEIEPLGEAVIGRMGREEFRLPMLLGKGFKGDYPLPFPQRD
ncbi:glycosyltransferase family 39 protein [Telmatospirillum sp. J64-1]|uniref:ArnT family glycosyltransferase n=1 Tax=Telmatospirillum sp. J64-1 TaxID=2502183 RepID=UPI00163DD23A|nr:glycosyltransferase family 39 protein [Telmatospirillum sp. J64-1]